MDINSLKSIFEVEVVETEHWEKRPHKNNFFEIVYVESGNGSQCINYNEFEYHSGNIFLLPPLNCHSFNIKERTKFYFIRFSDHFFLGKQSLGDHKAWFDSISYILANYNRVPGDIINTECERKYIIASIMTIHQEYLSSDNHSETIISSAIASILTILARSIEHKFIDRLQESDSRFSNIIRYINNNLLDNEKLKIPVIAETFGLSKGYFSDYFKRQAGVNLAEYIVKAKLKLAETYIIHTDQPIKEIAYNLNFADSSHFSNSFKKYYGKTVREFKKCGGVTCC